MFLDEERSYNPILDTVCAARASVGTLDGLLVLCEAGVFARTEGRDLSQSDVPKSMGTMDGKFNGGRNGEATVCSGGV